MLRSGLAIVPGVAKATCFRGNVRLLSGGVCIAMRMPQRNVLIVDMRMKSTDPNPPVNSSLANWKAHIFEWNVEVVS
jgi:hypothetical protein